MTQQVDLLVVIVRSWSERFPESLVDEGVKLACLLCSTVDVLSTVTQRSKVDTGGGGDSYPSSSVAEFSLGTGVPGYMVVTLGRSHWVWSWTVCCQGTWPRKVRVHLFHVLVCVYLYVRVSTGPEWYEEEKKIKVTTMDSSFPSPFFF